jgi:DNA-binding transcriptional regulator YiaG
MDHVAEIKALIEQHEKLLGELEQQRTNAPAPPEPHPSLMLQGKRVFIGPDGKPLPKARQAALAKREAERDRYLAVDLPFHSAYRPDWGAQLTETQAVMVAWRQALAATMKRLRDYCVWHGRESILKLFPLANYGANFGASMKAREIVEALRRHVTLLMRELEETDPKEHLLFRLWRDVPAVLREARDRAGHSREKAAEELRVTDHALKSWETSRRRPDGDNRLRCEKYVLVCFDFAR